ncbi:formate dehydrogenase accessory sulfurtransferase FdhD [Planobispora longispora]|uniref:Sulfur carrier protein FdhD n=1 Tax=Planobispora longispora TaxID=28887 RepID=A0A8J3W754_9ACTN|nr:formate dehydrogenase accessory sulfurtransferase FdhD [Planobispora longispora]GIH77491.1 sulfurtransferase FdhD [Planobispora longispora]
MGRVTVRRRVLRLRDTAASATAARGTAVRKVDVLAAEEPLEIRLGGRPLTVTMRTPGDDFDLAAGFLVGEGVISSAEEIVAIRYCAGAAEDGANTYNVLDVALAPGTAPPPASLERNFYTTSSCGVCGKASLDAVRTVARWRVDGDPVRVPAEVVSALPGRLREAQRVFDRTGGLHAAGLFTPDGRPLCVREDVGRHNAVDKLVGWAVRDGRLPLVSSVLMVSGRASFELVQKAVMAGIPVLAAVSAPSSLAVELAAETGLTLAGFVRDGSMNVYTGEERLSLASP